jgi:hypothetical protein
MSRMGTAEKLSVPQIQQAIKDGTLPAYVGIPLMQEKMKQSQPAQAAPEQPSIADQVMSQANASEQRGIPQLQSNLPAQGMAGGGIVALAGGGSYDDDDAELTDDEQDAADMAQANYAMDDSGMGSAIMNARNGPKATQVAYNGPGSSAYKGPGAGAMESVRSFFSKTPEAAPRQASESMFHHALSFILPHEGGYVNDKADKGGPTKFGVTKGTLEGYLGKKVSEDEVKNMPLDLAKQIYKEKYWDKIGGDQLDPKIAMLAFDTAVGSGVDKAKQMLSKYGDDPERFLEAKKQWMRDIVQRDPSQQKFDKGWQNRMNHLGDYIQKLPSADQGGIASLAAGGAVAHFYPGGLGADALGPFQNEADQLLAEARAKAAARAAARTAGSAAAPTVEAATAAAAPSAMRGVASLLGRATPYALMGSTAYGIGNAIMDKKQAEELAKYGPEGEPTDEELARASKPAFYPSMSPKVQQEQGIKPLAPLSYTPAGVATYGPRPGYTPPVHPAGGGRGKQGGATAAQSDAGHDAADAANQAAFEKLIQEKQDQPMAEEPAAAAPAAAKEPSSMDQYLASLKEGYGDIKKQKEEDKYLALLAAGLGMMGGTSPFAAANIGQGGLHGIQALATSNKDRAAEKNALDKAYGQGLYRQDLGANTQANKEALLGIQQGNLALNQKKELDAVLGNIQSTSERRALAALKTQGLIGNDTPGEEVAAKVSSWVNKDLANNKAYRQTYKERWGSDYDVPAAPAGGAGWSAKVR